VGSTPGDFTTFNNVTFDGGTRTFAEVSNLNGTELDLDVVATGTSATPEPSTFSMLFGVMMAGAAISWRTRRRAQGAR
jgi:PEP-CTERM motif